MRDLEVELPEVDPLGPVDDRDQKYHPRTLRSDHAAQAEHDEPLELTDDLYRQRQDDEEEEEQDYPDNDQSGHRLSPSFWLT